MQWLEALLKNMGEATIATDSKGRITYMNAVAAELLGLHAAEVLGIPLNELISLWEQATGRPVKLPLERVIANQEYYSADQGLVLEDTKGRFHRVTFIISPLKEATAATLGAVVALGVYKMDMLQREGGTMVNDKDDSQNSSEMNADFFFVKKEGNFVKVIANEILWIEAMENYAILVTKRERYVVHSTLKSLAAKLISQGFMRVHRSYIVPLNKIDAIEDNRLYIDGQSLPIGKSFKTKLMKSLMFI